jgi:hypothetical protein
MHEIGEKPQSATTSPSTVSDSLNQQKGGIYSDKTAFTTSNSSPHLVPVSFTEGGPGVSAPQKTENKAEDARYAAQLAAKYHVTFSKDGEKISVRGPDKKILSSTAHAPTMRELRAVDEALQKDPSAKGLKYDFLNQSLYPSTSVDGQYGADTTGQQSIFLMPAWDKTPAATTSDRTKPNQDTMSMTLLHEQVHREHEFNLNGRYDPKEVAIWAKLGWKRMPDRQWAIEAKDGTFYEPIDGGGNQNRFEHKDANGRPIDKSGKLVLDNSQAEIVDFRTLLSRAKIAPLNDYVSHPKEAEAEGLSVFRADKADRALLLKQRKPLYDQLKQIDQQDIDQIYPPVHGQSAKIRSADGTIVDNTPANRAAVQKFEEQAAK